MTVIGILEVDMRDTAADVCRSNVELRRRLATAHTVIARQQREITSWRAYGAAQTVCVALGTITAGVLMATGGDGRLQASFFAGHRAMIPGWPWTWAGAITLAGIVLLAGFARQNWTLGVTGSWLVASWAGTFAVLSWRSMALDHTGTIPWYPTATYGLIGGTAALLGWVLRRLAHEARRSDASG